MMLNRAITIGGGSAPNKSVLLTLYPMDTQVSTQQTSESINVSTTMGFAGQTAEFTNARVVDISSHVPPPISSSSNQFHDDSIMGFFKRPVLINSYTWPSTVTSGTQIANLDPWYLYLAVNTVQFKTRNYRKIRGDLCLRIVIQAAPTMYGHAIVQLLPQCTEAVGFPYTMPGTPLSLDVLPTIYQSTQDMYGDLCPATSETLEFKLPWISNQDDFDLATLASAGFPAGGPQTQWRLITHCIAPLGNATNASSVDSVTVRIYASIENCVLSIPLNNQAGKVKPRGKVGKAAAFVTDVAGRLRDVPFIGQFASGAEVVSSALGSVADWFGFTRETLSDDPVRIVPGILQGLPHADGQDTGVSLSILRDNAVAIEPALFGSGKDVDIESFADLFQRKTLIETISWSTSIAAGITLAYLPVTPFYCKRSVGDVYMYPLPSHFVGMMFAHWRGPMYYEVQVRCSSMHRGMLQIVYHPYYYDPSPDPTHTTYNKTVEIAPDQVFTFYVGWTQPWVMANTRQTAANPAAYTLAETNGMFEIRVQSKLTAPDPAASVLIEVYAYTDGDMIFTNPRQPEQGLYLQSGAFPDGMVGAAANDLMLLVGSPKDSAADVTAICGGERIQSVRTLLQRPFPYQSLVADGDTDIGVISYNRWLLPTALRPWRGPDPGTLGGIGAFAFTPLAWIPFMFVGWRGSLRNKFEARNFVGGLAIGPPGINTPVQMYAASVYSTDSGHSFAAEDAINAISLPDECGWSSVDPNIGAAVEVSAPFNFLWKYTISRFFPPLTDVGGTLQPGIAFGIRGSFRAVDGTVVAVRYLSAGQDFSLGRFRFVPRVEL